MNVLNYFNYTNSPWGKLFYQLAWSKLEFNKKQILDFGSGFGITSDHLAENNTVFAVEPNDKMVQYSKNRNRFNQIIGNINSLKQFNDRSFDVIICHNVLEYTENKAGIIEEFNRILKDDGIISIIKHNKHGKIMHKAVFEANSEEAMQLISGKTSESVNFGRISEYTTDELIDILNPNLKIEAIYGIRMFYGLQNNEIKYSPDWAEEMYNLEVLAENDPIFKSIAYFHHIIIKKVNYEQQ